MSLSIEIPIQSLSVDNTSFAEVLCIFAATLQLSFARGKVLRSVPPFRPTSSSSSSKFSSIHDHPISCLLLLDKTTPIHSLSTPGADFCHFSLTRFALLSRVISIARQMFLQFLFLSTFFLSDVGWIRWKVFGTWSWRHRLPGSGLAWFGYETRHDCEQCRWGGRDDDTQRTR